MASLSKMSSFLRMLSPARAHGVVCRLELAVLIAGAAAVLGVHGAAAQNATASITAHARPAPTPPWSKGIVPVNPESYYNAIECGKQGGADPSCVFWDTGLCKNDDFTLAWYTGYKQVAYEVWLAVSKKQPPPQPDYQAARRTHVTIGVTPAKGSTNALTDLVLKRQGKAVAALERSVSGGGGRFTFDYPKFAPTADLTLQLVGRTRTLSCLIPQAVLTQLR
jgi:hypothetical protein